MRGAAFAAALLAALTLPASATVRITADPGGQIGPYLDKLENLRKSGQNVVIDGACLSACTMILGVIPRDHLCVTPRARLGFHAAWMPDGAGHQVTSREGTDLLMDHYPQQIREWIAHRGGLSPHLIFLSGSELTAMYPACERDAGDRSGAARVESRQLLPAQQNELRAQAAVAVDPALHRRRIGGSKQARCRGCGISAAIGKIE